MPEKIEVSGRECSIYELGKDKLYLLSKFKGKEYRKVTQMALNGSVSTNDGIELNLGDFIERLDEVFEMFCMRIESTSGDVQPSLEYLDELDSADYGKLQDKLMGLIGEVFNPEKK